MRWNADAKIATLQSRSRLLTKIRQFFTQHNYLEVETPLLGKHTVTDPHIDSFSAQGKAQQPPQYLQTSPEFFMKRLLAHGSGPIYQICKAFRQEEQGKQHNPEFTILEFTSVFVPGPFTFTTINIRRFNKELVQHMCPCTNTRNVRPVQA